MNIKISEVKNRKDLKAFITFQRKLYQNCDSYTPPLDKMERALFSAKNPMAENCICKLWLAKKNDKIVGRIAGIINHSFNENLKIKQARFSHFDCINDKATAHQLLRTVENWARDQHSKEIIGPFGFNNLDKHGMLVEGFDVLACQSSNYNFPYYQELVESYGFEKKHDWVERTITVPEQQPERIGRFSKILRERNKLKTLNLSDKRTLKEYTPRILELYNKTYAELYGVSPLNAKQKEHLLKSFIPMLDTEMVSVVVNQENKIVAFGIAMLSLSKSLKKANGRLFPLGAYHLMRNKKGNTTLDLLLIGIHPDYKRKGIHTLIFDEINKGIVKYGIKTIETTQNLDSNKAVQNLWSDYESVLNRRARLFVKTI